MTQILKSVIGIARIVIILIRAIALLTFAPVVEQT